MNGWRVATIGVYGTTEDSFFSALTNFGATDFVDIRRRRGMRGSRYRYVNSSYLQERLHEAGIRYHHLLELAPTAELRASQHFHDASRGDSKRTRDELSSEFVRGYREQCLAQFNAQAFLQRLPEGSSIVLFCVERSPAACHRSIVADRVADALGTGVPDLTP